MNLNYALNVTTEQDQKGINKKWTCVWRLYFSEKSCCPLYFTPYQRLSRLKSTGNSVTLIASTKEGHAKRFLLGY